VGASERRDRLLARQQALRERHDELAGGDAPEELDAEALRRTDELMEVADELAAETGRRLLLATFVLLCVAIVPAVLVTFGVLPAPALLGSVLLLAVAVALGLTGRSMTRAGS